MELTLTSLTIADFCARNSLSRTSFYKMQRDGTGPKLMTVAGTMTRISIEAEAAWRRACEEVATAPVSKRKAKL